MFYGSKSSECDKDDGPSSSSTTPSVPTTTRKHILQVSTYQVSETSHGNRFDMKMQIFLCFRCAFWCFSTIANVCRMKTFNKRQEFPKKNYLERCNRCRWEKLHNGCWSWWSRAMQRNRKTSKLNQPMSLKWTMHSFRNCTGLWLCCGCGVK